MKQQKDMPKSMTNSSEEERLALFNVEELEARLEMEWSNVEELETRLEMGWSFSASYG